MYVFGSRDVDVPAEHLFMEADNRHQKSAAGYWLIRSTSRANSPVVAVWRITTWSVSSKYTGSFRLCRC